MNRILAIDIGGTNSRFALYDPDNLERAVLLKTYSSAQFASLEEVVNKFQQECSYQHPTAACIAIAGPVSEEGFITANLPWQISPPLTRKTIGIPKTCFINDFSAMAWACIYLKPQHLLTLKSGNPQPQFPKVVLGPGTGLGQSAVIPTSDGEQVIASEGGHTDFAPTNPQQDRLLQWLRSKYKPVSVERVLSGPGLLNIYHFLNQAEGIPESPATRARMGSQDAGIAITQAALKQDDALAQQTLQLFCEALVTETSNLVLKYLAKGGAYLCGDFVNNIVPLLNQPQFIHLFTNRGRLSTTMEQIPLYVVAHPSPGLLGAAVVASRL